MEFTKLDIKNHDLDKASELIYQEQKLKLIFNKNEKKGHKQIKKLISIGNNYYGYEKIYVACKNTEILGLLIMNFHGDNNGIFKYITYLRVFNIVEILRIILYSVPILTSLTYTEKNLKENECQIRTFIVDKNHRRKGIGIFLLEKAVNFAKKKGCKRIILDVFSDNIEAVNCYKKFGFSVYGKKSISYKSKIMKSYNMEYIL